MSKTEDTIAGLQHGVLGLFGFGSAYDPLGDLQSELSNAQQNMQAVINTASYASIKEQTVLNKDLWSYIQTNNSDIQATMELYNQLAMDDMQKENLFISILSSLIIIIIFFMLIK